MAQTSISLGETDKKKIFSLISISQSSLWRQQREIDGLARINSWNLWQQSVCVRTRPEFPRIQFESRLEWLKPKTCSDTWVYRLIYKMTLGKYIKSRAAGEGKIVSHPGEVTWCEYHFVAAAGTNVVILLYGIVHAIKGTSTFRRHLYFSLSAGDLRSLNKSHNPLAVCGPRWFN